MLKNTETPIKPNKKINVLDKGYVELLDSMGSDLTIVNAARVSFGKQKDVLDLTDEKLINYLAKHNHWTPFSQCQIQLRIKIPIFLARQYFKSTIGLSRNEISRRYVKSPPEFHLQTEWRLAAENVKQGSSSDVSEESLILSEEVKQYFELGEKLYNKLLEKNICAEQARIVLTQAMYTEFIETGSLAAYARIYNLRTEATAQKDIHPYGFAIGEIGSELFPVAWKALTNHEKEIY